MENIRKIYPAALTEEEVKLIADQYLYECLSALFDKNSKKTFGITELCRMFNVSPLRLHGIILYWQISAIEGSERYRLYDFAQRIGDAGTLEVFVNANYFDKGVFEIMASKNPGIDKIKKELSVKKS